MVSPTRENPRTGTNFQIWFWYPQGTGYRKLRHRSIQGDHFYFVDDQPESVSHIYQRSIQCLSGFDRKDRTDGIGFTSDSQLVYFYPWFFLSDGFAHFKHMCSQNLGATRMKVIGVVCLLYTSPSPRDGLLS